MDGIDPRDVEFVLSLMPNGFVFEKFGQEFLSKIVGHEFIPVGGIRDRGIDGLEHTFSSQGRETNIYQLSIEQNAKAKITKTIAALRKNSVQCERMFYVTNRKVDDIYGLQEEFYSSSKIHVQIWDIGWFKININNSQGTKDVFRRFQSQYLTKYNQPGVAYEVIDLYSDPRLYVFLRQQWDASQRTSALEEVLADSLILFALEGTDPDKGILRSQDDILSQILAITHFDPKWLYPTIDQRLKVLSTKPRRIRHHRQENAYCLPYETRCEMQEQNINDAALHEDFIGTSKRQLESLLADQGLCCTNEVFGLLEQVLHDLFKQQGLEFAEFITTGDSKQSVEKSIHDIISNVVDGSRVIPANREAIRSTLLMSIRQMVYRGTEAQQGFLRRLADTYKMLFLLQCDPQIASYFAATASRLRVYVDNSILIPALSENFLESGHRRYWNLLVRAREAGVTLLVNEIIIRELSSHFRRLRNIYNMEYAGLEGVYGTEEAVIYIPDILIRAFFYARINKQVDTFDEFLDVFVPLDMKTVDEDLIHWLREAFGIRYESSRSLELEIDPNEEEHLYEELKKLKGSDQQARSDARQLLMIYALREQNNETGTANVFGYHTWWLTTDINTVKAHQTVSGDNVAYQTSPYIRADFLYNYISLAPSKQDVEVVYKGTFPTLLGVQISHHLPNDISEAIRKFLIEHRNVVNEPRLKIVMRKLSNKLKSDPTNWNREKVELWLDNQKNEWSKQVK